MMEYLLLKCRMASRRLQTSSAVNVSRFVPPYPGFELDHPAWNVVPAARIRYGFLTLGVIISAILFCVV